MRFRITYTQPFGYRVDVPNYDGGEVVTADEHDRLRMAIQAHRARWQRANGINPGDARPADLELWAALEPTKEPPS